MALQPEIFPSKQFIEFPGTGSLFARTLERAAAISAADALLVISSRQHGFLCHKVARQVGLEAHYILEETGRNTAPAIYFAALASDPEDILLIMPSDHWIEDLETFTALAMRGVEICKTGVWLTFGITPTAPATGYGYIEADAGSPACAMSAHSPKSRTLLLPRNISHPEDISGIPVSSWSRPVPALKALIATSRNSAKPQPLAGHARTQRAHEDILAGPDLEAVPAISVDYAIMEKEDRIALLPFDGGWSDVGSWDSLLSLITSTAPDHDTVSVLVNSQNVFVHGSGRTIAGDGLEDLIIVDDDDATLIVRKGHTEQVKKVIDALAAVGNSAGIEHSYEYRPWGMFENLIGLRCMQGEAVVG